jgi:CTD small phosphatase-like protein 2
VPVAVPGPPFLPPIKNPNGYTVVLDLDETLVHFEAKEKKFKLRPGCLKFLKDVAAAKSLCTPETGSPYEINFEIVIFTAAAQDYADFILNYIDKEPNHISHRLYRQHCRYDDGVYVKDLTLLGRDLSKTLIVDNIKDNFERQPQNGIEILTWLNDPTDRELPKLGNFL